MAKKVQRHNTTKTHTHSRTHSETFRFINGVLLLFKANDEDDNESS